VTGGRAEEAVPESDAPVILILTASSEPGAADFFERKGAVVRRVQTVQEAARLLDIAPVDLAVVDLDDADAAAGACAVIREKLGPVTPIAAVVLDPRDGSPDGGPSDDMTDDGTARDIRRSGADFALRDLEQMTAFLDEWDALVRLARRVRVLEKEIPVRMKELHDVRTFTDELVASLPLKLFVVDEDIRLLFANRTALEAAQLASAAAVGRKLSEITPAAAEDGALSAVIRGAVLDGKPGRIGGMHVPADPRPDESDEPEAGRPEERVVNAEARPCHVAGMRSALVTISDITDAWQAESGRLRESRKLTEVVDTIGAGLATLDEDLRITWTNRKFVEWFGANTDRGCRAVLSSMHGDCNDCPARRALAGGTHETVIRHRYGAEGRRRSFQESFARIEEPGGVASLILLIQDVTGQVDQLEQMRLVERISRAVQGVRDLDQLLHLILTCVTTGHALGFNRAFLFLRNRGTNTLNGRMALGPASAEEAGRVWGELSESQRTLDDALRDARDIAPLETPLFELIRDCRYSLDDAQELPVRVFRERRAMLVSNAWDDDRVTPAFRERFGATELVAVPLLSKGRSVGVLMADNIYNDRPIGERDRAVLEMFASPAGLAIENAEAFADLRESLRTIKRTRRQLVDQTKLAAIGRVAAHIAHEIRNPLATIGGFAHAISSRPMPEARVRENAQIVYDEVRRLERMLSGIMDFSRPAHPVPVRQSLNAAVARTARMLAEQFAPRVAIEFSPDPAAPLAAFDAGQIEQVLMNLVKNSAEAMGESGGRVRVATVARDAAAVISIADDGPGIPGDLHERIFEPFFTTKKGGTGLGLAVCRQIIAEHGGEMRVESDPGTGTTFRVVLPFEPPPAEAQGENLP
jgi:signal transduction histidine kinase